jgi:hypothetical protein
MNEIELLKGVLAFDGDFIFENADLRFNLRAQRLMVKIACSLNLQSTI